MNDLVAKTEKAKARIHSALNKHGKGVLWLSGGKDSLVVHHLCLEHMENLIVAWVNSGAAFPHMEELIRRYNVVEIKANQPFQVATTGYPADIAPAQRTIFEKMGNPLLEGPLLQDWRMCCLSNRWLPGNQFMERSGRTLSIHGQRRQDKGTAQMFGVGDAQMYGNIEACALIHDWTTDEVMDYAFIHNIELPKQYPACKSSIDCWSCTAAKGDGPGWFIERYNFMKAEYPELAKELKRRVRIVKEIIEEEAVKTASDLNAVLHEIEEPGELQDENAA